MRCVKICRSSRIVRRVVPNNVHLANEDGATDGHRDGDDGKINPCKIEPLNVNVFPSKDISPQETSERCAEGGTESSIVHAKSHSIYCCPERPIGDGGMVCVVDIRPCLDYTAEKNGSSNIGARKLLVVSWLYLTGDRGVLALQRTTDRKPMPPMAPTVPVLLTQ